jgi:hypothetical protein
MGDKMTVAGKAKMKQAAKRIDALQDKLESAVSRRVSSVTLNLADAWLLLAVARHLPRDAFWLAECLQQDSEVMWQAGHPIKAARIARAAHAIERCAISAGL